MSVIIGHKKVLDFFTKVIDHDNLSHAYCFVGPASVGKRTVAEHISAHILGIDADKLRSQPDVTIVEQGINEKTGKTKRNIDVDQIRHLRGVLARHSFLGGYKIAIIDEAHKMNSNAANALLKTLEEPKDKTILFLLTTDEALLPQTIQSRCQMVYLHPVANSDIHNHVAQLGAAETAAQELARLSTGLPGRAIGWYQDPDALNEHKQELKRFMSLFDKPFYEKRAAVDELFGDKTDHNAAREKLQDILQIWKVLLRDALVGEEQKIHATSPTLHGVDHGLRIMTSVDQAKAMLQKNIHPRLLVEHILLAI